MIYQPIFRLMTNRICGLEAFVDAKDGEETDIWFLLEEICKDMQKSLQEQGVLIPVSTSVSYQVFLECDFYKEIEEISQKYEMPRDMFCIEVADIADVNLDQDTLAAVKKELKRLRDGGYQVWLNHYTGGFFLLNLLREGIANGVKFEKGYLSFMEEGTKEVFAKMTSLIKELGVLTLVSDIENDDQLSFLKEIGCNMGQGDFLGKPYPYGKFPATKGLPQRMEDVFEKRFLRRYQDQIDLVDVLTDRACAIVEFDGKDFTYLHINREFLGVWERIGTKDIEQVYQNINSEASPLAEQFRRIQRVTHFGDDTKSVVYVIRGHHVRLNAKCIAEQNPYCAYEVEIIDLTREDDVDNSKRESLDFRMMYTLFDSIYWVDLDDRSIEVVKGGISNQPELEMAFFERGTLDVVKLNEAFIDPRDWEEYQKFVDTTTLAKRLEDAGGANRLPNISGHLSGMVRTRGKHIRYFP